MLDLIRLSSDEDGDANSHLHVRGDFRIENDTSVSAGKIVDTASTAG